MAGFNRRKSFFYDGTGVTTYRISELLPTVLGKINAQHLQRTDLLLSFWPEMIGPELSRMTQAVSFENGILMIKVRNSTLYSLLNQHEKPRLLQRLRRRFPEVEIRGLLFRMG